jgi:CheY-like chemotaxis protein
MKAEKKEELFKAYLKDCEIVIADKSSASRRRLVKTLVDMGASRQKVHSIAHYSEAIEVMDSKKPKLVLSDFAMNGGSGFDLFKYYRENFPDEKQSVLILVTSNISQSAVAKAAEEDVDSFIIKPYTVQSLEKSLINTVIAKLYPSSYIQKIEEGKEKLFAADYEGAMVCFDEALPMNKKPSLALFYHGQAKYFLELSDEAQDDYKKGLEINNIHFKCQIGLYEIFKKDGKLNEAYDVVKNIAKYFPANPERLKEVIHLAIKTEHYLDIEIYYDLFTGLDERSDDLINYVCSGMYVCGKYLFGLGEETKARAIYEKTAISAAGTSKFLKAMVITLVENNVHEDAQKLLSRFGSGADDESDYLISSYLANSADMEVTEKISKGMELFNKGHKHPDCVTILIDSLREDGSDKKANDFQEEANHTWPDLFPIAPLAA